MKCKLSFCESDALPKSFGLCSHHRELIKNAMELMNILADSPIDSYFFASFVYASLREIGRTIASQSELDAVEQDAESLAAYIHKGASSPIR